MGKNCRDCKTEAAPGKTRCQGCLDKRSDYMIRWKAAQAAAGKCSKCGKFKPEKGFRTCKKCKEYFNTWHKDNYERRKETLTKISREAHARTREKVIKGYGETCICCKETNPKFLTLDHVNNDGKLHREEIGSGGSDINTWAVKNNFPSNLQLLCYNCNLGKAKNGGICPHKD